MSHKTTDIIVSVVVPVYNGEKTLEKTLESILAQSFKDIEILIVDDGSFDRSREIVDKYLKIDKRIRYLSQKNGGVASARNVGINWAKGDYIAFCDQDDLWLPEKLKLQLPFFENPDVGLVYGWVIVDEYGKTESIVAREYVGDCFDYLLSSNFITCCSVITRKQILDEIGGFNEDRDLMGVDDRYTWLCISLISKFEVVREPIAVYIRHGDNYSLNDKKMLKADLCCLARLVKVHKNRLTDHQIDSAKLNIFLHYANNFLYCNQYDESRKCYREAIKLNYFQPTIVIKYLIVALFPAVVINTAKKIRRTLF